MTSQKSPLKLLKEFRIRPSADTEPKDDGSVFEKHGLRFALLLSEELEYALCKSNIILVWYDFDRIDSMSLFGASPALSKNLYEARLSFDRDKLQANFFEYLSNRLAEFLTEIAQRENNSIEPIETARKRLIADAEITEILLKRKVLITKTLIIEPVVRVKGFGLSAQLFLKVTDLVSARSKKRLVIQGSILEIRDLCDRILYKDGFIVLKSKVTSVTEAYGQRGFKVPIVFSLEDWFSDRP
ncbi:MAG: hypothetical protein IPP97_06815 [Candidatus Obscuribacter sp.]|nr:hypothetical protein [Candidatus Obscuribacter sp.]MBP6347959.1 hypothetical protein [Candidatus Obscuribacter sp.]MBP6591412.1 hypothetical protein [Candidatus Obscuribacter sp.]MBP7575162.1 hypothetical protein [Candidatus Obscuribacter sp.]